MKNEQEEKKAVPTDDNVLNLGATTTTASDMHMKDVNNPEVTLNSLQIEQIEKEVTRKLKKERTFEAGMKQVRERAPFHL